MTKVITFTDTRGVSKEHYPIPASKMVPEWYKNTESYIGGKKIPNGKGVTLGTIKKCMPVFDAITGGYLILLPADIYVSQKEGIPYYEWSGFDLISSHPIEQAPKHPLENGFGYPKFMNPWSIKTAPGYSTLFTQPLHRTASFTILTGIVDTDIYHAPVNFPFVLNDAKFEGFIPSGTPIAQVIPIKRDVWQMKIGDKSVDVEGINRRLESKFFDRYKNMFWYKKEYK